MRNADMAMYQAKRNGRDNYQFFAPEMNARTQETLTLERALRSALAGEEFRLHFQP